MNERIRELALQAGIDCLVPSKGTLEYAGKGEVDHLKKFALLIVRECARVCRSQPNEYALAVDRENCASAIEDHFGVER